MVVRHPTQGNILGFFKAMFKTSNNPMVMLLFVSIAYLFVAKVAPVVDKLADVGGDAVKSVSSVVKVIVRAANLFLKVSEDVHVTPKQAKKVLATATQFTEALVNPAETKVGNTADFCALKFLDERKWNTNRVVKNCKKDPELKVRAMTAIHSMVLNGSIRLEPAVVQKLLDIALKLDLS
jgi:hypothetical protein